MPKNVTFGSQRFDQWMKRLRTFGKSRWDMLSGLRVGGKGKFVYDPTPVETKPKRFMRNLICTLSNVALLEFGAENWELNDFNSFFKFYDLNEYIWKQEKGLNYNAISFGTDLRINQHVYEKTWQNFVQLSFSLTSRLETLRLRSECHRPMQINPYANIKSSRTVNGGWLDVNLLWRGSSSRRWKVSRPIWESMNQSRHRICELWVTSLNLLRGGEIRTSPLWQ